MEVNIESVGKEDGHYTDHVVNVSLEHSFAEAALRLQLAGGVKIDDMATIVICDAHDSHETINQLVDSLSALQNIQVLTGCMSDTQSLVKKLAESIKELPVFDEPEPEQNDWYYSGKKVAQWKRETQYTRQKKK